MSWHCRVQGHCQLCAHDAARSLPNNCPPRCSVLPASMPLRFRRLPYVVNCMCVRPPAHLCTTGALIRRELRVCSSSCSLVHYWCPHSSESSPARRSHRNCRCPHIEPFGLSSAADNLLWLLLRSISHFEALLCVESSTKHCSMRPLNFSATPQALLRRSTNCCRTP